MDQKISKFSIKGIFSFLILRQIPTRTNHCVKLKRASFYYDFYSNIQGASINDVRLGLLKVGGRGVKNVGIYLIKRQQRGREVGS